MSRAGKSQIHNMLFVSCCCNVWPRWFATCVHHGCRYLVQITLASSLSTARVLQGGFKIGVVVRHHVVCQIMFHVGACGLGSVSTLVAWAAIMSSTVCVRQVVLSFRTLGLPVAALW